MSYYFISLDPERFGQFINGFSFLANGIWVKDKNHLLSELGRQKPDSLFFVHRTKQDLKIDDFVLTLRSKVKDSKIIYVTPPISKEKQEEHRDSPVGGDFYIQESISEDALKQLLRELENIDLNKQGNKLERREEELPERLGFDLKALKDLQLHPKSEELDQVFKSLLKPTDKKPMLQSTESFTAEAILVENVGEGMSDNDKELSLEDLGDLELGDDDATQVASIPDEGLELDLDTGDDLDLSENTGTASTGAQEDAGMELSLDDSDDLSLNFNDEPSSASLEVAEDFNLDNTSTKVSLDLSAELPETENLDDDLSLSDEGLDLSLDDSLELGEEFSEDAQEKLKEIDAIMDHDSSQTNINPDIAFSESSLDEPLVSSNLNLDSLNFGSLEDVDEIAAAVVKEKEERPKRKKKEDRDLGQDLREISGAYSGEMERLQATLSNLRADREELLAKIQRFEEEKVLQNRSTLSIRAELDEKKIELSIIRKKLNDEISDLKDRLKLFDEKKLILEERNKLLSQELDKAGQKNKIDLKKVQMRERELEQKLELLKSDAETQIRNRDLKILELKRKIDAMEFDMESISQQEKRSVESRFELEDKLEKAIKTLRSAINVLENESERGNVLDALKKNLDV